MAEAMFTPVQPVKAYERIVEQIEEAIFSSSLKPGDRLPSERELMVQLSVSRSTVREALRVLESNGLVRSRPGDPNGPEVQAFSGATLGKSMTRLLRTDELSLANVVQYRMLLDGSAAFLAAKLADEDQLAALADIHTMLGEAAAAGDYELFSATDVAFHEAIAQASGNPLIAVCMQAVRAVVIELIASKIVQSKDRKTLMKRSLAHHGELLEAMRARDGKRAEQMARIHLVEYYAEKLPQRDREQLELFL